MPDGIARQRITVDGQALTGASILVPMDQLTSVTDALTSGGVKFWVDDDGIQVDDHPPVIFIQLSRSSDVVAVQQILDGM